MSLLTNSKRVFLKLKPNSLAAQMILVVLLALILAQAFSLIILGSAYRTVIYDINKKARVQQMESLVYLLEDSDWKQYQAILSAARSRGVVFTISEESLTPMNKVDFQAERLIQALESRLGKNYQNKVKVDIERRENNPMPQKDCNKGEGRCFQPREDWHKHQAMRGPKYRARQIRLMISVQMENGFWLNMRASAPVAPPLAARQTFIFLGLSILFVLLALAVMIRRITRPMGLLAEASHRLGRGEQVDALPEQGAKDIRNMIRAFNQMNNRLQRFVSDRTRMLAALSHDLRTPMTTMRLRVEMMPESTDRDQLLSTLDEMQQMSEATLAFMRQASDNEPTRQVDLNAMLESLCEDQQDLGQDVQFIDGDPIIVSCRLVSLKRAIRNLIENAVKYGEQAKVSLQSSDIHAIILIQDSGPGIPEHQLDKVFEPFFRLESSRNRDTGGIGLGMAIARNIIRNHGGEIYLENNKLGLVVKILLPAG